MTSPAEIVVPRARTLEAFLRAYPWPEDRLLLGRPLEFLWHFDLNVSPAELWPYAMDTSHFNRALGMKRMEYREISGVLHGTTRNGGIVQEWVEEPWTWVAQRTLTCGRRYSRGFGRYLRSIYELEPQDGGRHVRLHVYFGWIPRNMWTRVILKLAFPSIAGGYRKLLAEIEAHIKDARAVPSPYEQRAPELIPEVRARLDTVRRQLRTRLEERRLSTVPLDRLMEYLTHGDDLDLYRIQILPLARRWQIDQTELLMVCLHATRVGLLGLTWDVICPHCRGVRQEARTLGDMPTRAACEVCAIDFETSADNAVEITFHLHPSIRDVPQQLYCAAEPATKRHINVQQRLGPGQRARIETALPPGHYRLRTLGEQSWRIIDVVEGEGEPEAVFRSGDEGAPLSLAPSPVLELVNDGDIEQTFIVEEAAWSDNALRPVQLFTLQEFRDLFTEEYLDADVQLSIGEQSILFTDMIGSTRFYDTRGDPEAFSEVKRHFREVYEVVRTNRGAVVKTIGDAVMAAFHSPVDALKAAASIHARFPAGREDTSIRLRISINRGPCIAVNLNSAIDYFGRTVNIASKLQACVEAGQISFPRVMRDAPGVAEFLESKGAELEEVVVSAASLKTPIEAYRWDVNGPIKS